MSTKEEKYPLQTYYHRNLTLLSIFRKMYSERYNKTKGLACGSIIASVLSVVFFLVTVLFGMCTRFNGHWYCVTKSHGDIRVIDEYILAKSVLTYKSRSVLDSLDVVNMSKGLLESFDSPGVEWQQLVSNETTYHQILVVEDLDGNGCDISYRNSTVLKFSSPPVSLPAVKSFSSCGTQIPDLSAVVYILMCFWAITAVLIIATLISWLVESEILKRYPFSRGSIEYDRLSVNNIV